MECKGCLTLFGVETNTFSLFGPDISRSAFKLKDRRIISITEIRSNIKESFNHLENDFDNISNRMVWIGMLKTYLISFEDELTEPYYKYLSWFVSTLRDVLAFNYAENITKEQLSLIKKGVEMICEKPMDCDKNSFEKYYAELLETGLSLLPTGKEFLDDEEQDNNSVNLDD